MPGSSGDGAQKEQRAAEIGHRNEVTEGETVGDEDTQRVSHFGDVDKRGEAEARRAYYGRPVDEQELLRRLYDGYMTVT